MSPHIDQPPLSPRSVTLLLVSVLLVLHLAAPGALLPAPTFSASAWAAWFRATDPIPAAIAIVRLLTLAAGYHLLVMHVLATLARRVDIPALARLADRFTPPPLRTSIGAVAGIGLTAATSLAGSVASAGADPVTSNAAIQIVDPVASTATVVVIDDIGRFEARRADDPDQEPPSGRAVMVAEPPVVAEAQGVPQSQGETEPVSTRADLGGTHVVRPGDHLWSIAEREHAAAGTDADEASVERYWQRLLTANPQIEDPDLVFPGDVITLPPLGHTG